MTVAAPVTTRDYDTLRALLDAPAARVVAPWNDQHPAWHAPGAEDAEDFGLVGAPPPWTMTANVECRLKILALGAMHVAGMTAWSMVPEPLRRPRPTDPWSRVVDRLFEIPDAKRLRRAAAQLRNMRRPDTVARFVVLCGILCEALGRGPRWSFFCRWWARVRCRLAVANATSLDLDAIDLDHE